MFENIVDDFIETHLEVHEGQNPIEENKVTYFLCGGN